MLVEIWKLIINLNELIFKDFSRQIIPGKIYGDSFIFKRIRVCNRKEEKINNFIISITLSESYRRAKKQKRFIREKNEIEQELYNQIQ
jgi:hypothetical protein